MIAGLFSLKKYFSTIAISTMVQGRGRTKSFGFPHHRRDALGCPQIPFEILKCFFHLGSAAQARGQHLVPYTLKYSVPIFSKDPESQEHTIVWFVGPL